MFIRTQYPDQLRPTTWQYDVILYAVYFYVRYAVSHRDLEEILAERGVHSKRRPRPIDFHGSVALMEQRVSF